jgi:hypothetical protein
MFAVNKQSAQTILPHILDLFNDRLDCLTAYLMLECSEVLAGFKPANLISLVNRTRSCGRNLYQFWQCHHKELATRLAGLGFILLETRERALMLLYPFFCHNIDTEHQYRKQGDL